MSPVEAAMSRFLGGTLQVIGVMLICYAGLCACGMLATGDGGEFAPPRDTWWQVVGALPGGFGCWFGGRWFIRRGRTAGPPPDRQA
jgi:hypothetical protein